MTKAETEKSKAAFSDAVTKINAIDAKIAEFKAQYQKLLELRTKGLMFCGRTVKALDEQSREECFDGLNPALVADIKKNMFLFEDIAKLDRRHIQKILFKCDLKDIAYAVKLLDGTEVKKQIYSNISKNNITVVRQEEELMGDSSQVDKAEVFASQQRIVAVALQLEESGEIFFPDGL